MATTLTEAEKFTANMVRRGVLRTIIKDSVVMQKLPFIDVVGNAYQYLRENVLPTVQFYSPNEVWSEDTPEWTQVTAVIKIMGGDADVDNFIQATRSDKTDIQAETLTEKAKALKHTFLDKFYYGDTAASSKEFDGLNKLITSLTAQQLHMGSGTTGAALSMATLDEAMDLVKDGKGDCILVTRAIRRRINQFIRASGGGNLQVADRDQWGNVVQAYNGIPVEYDDFLTQTEAISSGAYSAKTGGVTSSLWYLRFGTKDVVGLQNGGIETKKIGQLESKDAVRWRVKWYPSLALMRDISIARIDGITNVAAVA